MTPTHRAAASETWAIARGTLQLLLASFSLLLRAFPHLATITLLSPVALWVALKCTWTAILCFNPPRTFDTPLANFCLTLILSFWLASAAFILAEARQKRPVSLSRTLKSGWRRIFPAWLLLIGGLSLIYFPVLLLENLGREPLPAAPLALGVAFWCVVLVSLPYRISSQLLERPAEAAPAYSRVSFLIASIILLGLGSVLGDFLAKGLWLARLNFFLATALVLPTVFSFPLASLITLTHQAKQPRP